MLLRGLKISECTLSVSDMYVFDKRRTIFARRAYCVGSPNKMMCVCVRPYVRSSVRSFVTPILGPRKCRYRSRMVKNSGPKVTFVSNSGSDLNWMSNRVE